MNSWDIEADTAGIGRCRCCCKSLADRECIGWARCSLGSFVRTESIGWFREWDNTPIHIQCRLFRCSWGSWRQCCCTHLSTYTNYRWVDSPIHMRNKLNLSSYYSWGSSRVWSWRTECNGWGWNILNILKYSKTELDWRYQRVRRCHWRRLLKRITTVELQFCKQKSWICMNACLSWFI